MRTDAFDGRTARHTSQHLLASQRNGHASQSRERLDYRYHFADISFRQRTFDVDGPYDVRPADDRYRDLGQGVAAGDLPYEFDFVARIQRCLAGDDCTDICRCVLVMPPRGVLSENWDNRFGIGHPLGRASSEAPTDQDGGFRGLTCADEP